MSMNQATGSLTDLVPEPRRRGDFQIGIICALDVELAAMQAMLDDEYVDMGDSTEMRKGERDPNAYTFGRIRKHYIIIACLGAGQTGIGDAATTATHMQRSFPAIKFGLLVGIGGGIWSQRHDVRLGDVVVSEPTDEHGGVVQWSFGALRNGELHRKGHLNQPPSVLLQALSKSKAHKRQHGIELETAVADMTRRYPYMAAEYKCPGREDDRLFQSEYNHTGNVDKCSDCRRAAEIKREPRDDRAIVHYGNIASGNQVVKDSAIRDQLSKSDDFLCVEMEAAGLMNDFPCLVIRGIADYADSHKNDTWQPWAAATAASFAKRLLNFVDKEMVDKTEKSHYYIPFEQNHHFVGREAQLEELESKLWPSDRSLNYCPQAAICGLGGVGKTAIAVELAYRTKKKQPRRSVFWVAAISREAFDQSYREIGECLEIPGLKDEKSDVKELVRSELNKESFGQWLLIVDNADDASLFTKNLDGSTEARPLTDYLPVSNKGAILFTTRNRKAIADRVRGGIMDVEELNEAEAEHALANYLSQKDLLEDKAAVAKLLKLLTYLPLAIVQAAAYLESNKDTAISTYISHFEDTNDEMIELLSKNFGDGTRYEETKNPIATTWLISFDHIKRDDGLAIEYLSFMACLLHENIATSLLLDKGQKLKLADTEALGTLTAYAFISKRPKEQGQEDCYDMHRLVHVVTRNWLKEHDELSNWDDKALVRLTSLIPSGGHKDREKWVIYLPHGLHVAHSSDLIGDGELKRHILLDKVGRCQSSIGQYTAAVQTHEQVLKFRTLKLGGEHNDTMISMNELGLALNYQGKYAESETILRETLALMEKILGKEHLNTLANMNNLGSILSYQGKYAEAETILRETLALMEKILGKEHPNTLANMNNLGLALSYQGKYVEAEMMFRETLALRKKVLGIEHPETLTSINNLGFVFTYLRKYAEAETIFRETLALLKKILGIEHPGTLVGMNNLGFALNGQGKYIEAETLYRETLALREKVLGKEHPAILTSMINLNEALSGQGKFVQAELLRKQIQQRRHII